MTDEVQVNTQEASQEASAASVSAEDQAAINRYRESQMTAEEKAQGVPEGYNEDGTVKEELIAGKFKSQEDLVKAYEELQKKLGQPREETTVEPDKKSEPQSDKETETSENTEGFSAAVYEKEYAETGELSEKSYADLQKMGFTREQVNAYIQGQTAYANSLRSEIYESVGGEESYANLVQWASQNIDPAALKEYNDAVDSMDKPRIMRSLEYMNLKYGQSAPREPRRLEGDAPAGGMQPYANKNEWQRDMTNRLYGKDPKYTTMVDNRYLAARKRGNI